MSAWKKTVTCMDCGVEMEMKSFRKNPGKKIFGKGYLCDECAEKRALEDEAPAAEAENTPEAPAAQEANAEKPAEKAEEPKEEPKEEAQEEPKAAESAEAEDDDDEEDWDENATVEVEDVE